MCECVTLANEAGTPPTHTHTHSLSLSRLARSLSLSRSLSCCRQQQPRRSFVSPPPPSLSLCGSLRAAVSLCARLPAFSLFVCRGDVLSFLFCCWLCCCRRRHRRLFFSFGFVVPSCVCFVWVRCCCCCCCCCPFLGVAVGLSRWWSSFRFFFFF